MTDNKVVISKDLAAAVNKYKSASADDMKQTSYPLLKIVAEKTKAPMPDGTKAKLGNLYLSDSKTEHKSLNVRILASTAGYFPRFDAIKKYKKRNPNASGDMKTLLLDEIDEFDKTAFAERFSLNQIVAGTVVGKSEAEPFLMFLSGHKLQNFWQLRGDLSSAANKLELLPYMFNVKITTEEIETVYGSTYVGIFSIVTDKNKLPKIDISGAEAELLGSKIVKIKEFLTEYRDSNGYKSVEYANDIWDSKNKSQVVQATPEEDMGDTPTQQKLNSGAATEEVNPDDIPF